MKKILFIAIGFIISISFSANGALGADVCVNNATDLQSALTTASSSGESDVVRVVQGTYYGNFSYSSGETYSFTLLGGYNPGCTTRDVDPANTVLDAQGSSRVLSLSTSNEGSITLDGFTLQNGSTTSSGGGLSAYTTSSSSNAGDITLSNNIFKGNSADDFGGGVRAYSHLTSGTAGDVILINNIIAENTVVDTNAQGGGGVYAVSSSGTDLGGTVTFINNTVTANTTSGSSARGGGIFLYRNNNIINCYNNIIRGNTATTSDDIYISGSGGTTYGYNNNYSDISQSWDNSSGETDVDSQFIDPDNGDFRLRSSSPCIDAGETMVPTPPDLPSTDFEGDTRIIDSTVDIGADEVSIVTTCASVSGETTLQDALDAAQGNGKGDVIMIQQGTYARSGNFSCTSSEGKDITLLGGYTSSCSSRTIQPANTTLHAVSSGSVLYLNNTNGGDITIEGFTIQNGTSDAAGAGVFARSYSFSGVSGDITFKKNNITNNTGTAASGGGVYALSESDADAAGDITFFENTISGNTGYTGGGLATSSDSSSNKAGMVTLTKNTISGNTATNTGGGARIRSFSYGVGNGGSIHLTDNIITENKSNNSGGGVQLFSEAALGDADTITLVNNIISGNIANDDNGGAYINSNASSGTAGIVTLTNNTIANNTASDSCGGVRLIILQVSQTVEAYNNIIRGNNQTNGGEITIVGTNGTANSYNNNYSTKSGSWNSETGSIDLDPKLSSDYHLRPGSPCIDMGTNTAFFLPSTDIDGDDRMIDGDRDDTATVDIGADEYIPKGVIAHFLILLL